jgi:hypothetical protein
MEFSLIEKINIQPVVLCGGSGACLWPLSRSGFPKQTLRIAGADNFAKNEVVKYFDAEAHVELKNADHIDQHGLYIGNHHYPIREVVPALRSI